MIVPTSRSASPVSIIPPPARPNMPASPEAHSDGYSSPTPASPAWLGVAGSESSSSLEDLCPPCKCCDGSGQSHTTFTVERQGHVGVARWQEHAIQATARVSAVAVNPEDPSTWTLVHTPSRPISAGEFISVQLREGGQTKPSIFYLAVVVSERATERDWREFVIRSTLGDGRHGYLQVPLCWCEQNPLKRIAHWLRLSWLPSTITPLAPATLARPYPSPPERINFLEARVRKRGTDIEFVRMEEGRL